VRPRRGPLPEIKKNRRSKSLLVPILYTATVFLTLLCDNDAGNAIADWSNIRAVLNSHLNPQILELPGQTADKITPIKQLGEKPE